MRYLFTLLVMLLCCAPVMAQSDKSIDDEIQPTVKSGMQIYKQNAPLIMYSNMADNIVSINNDTATDNFYPIPDTQLDITNSQTISALISFNVNIASAVDLYVDNKKELRVFTLNSSTASHLVRLAPGRHQIELRVIVFAGTRTGFDFREINALTF